MSLSELQCKYRLHLITNPLPHFSWHFPSKRNTLSVEEVNMLKVLQSLLELNLFLGTKLKTQMWTRWHWTGEAIHMLYRQHKQQRTRFACFQLWRGRNDSPLCSCSSKHNPISSSKENAMDNLEGLNGKRSPQQNLNEHGATGNMTQYNNKAAMANTSSRTPFINCAYNPTPPEITNS